MIGARPRRDEADPNLISSRDNRWLKLFRAALSASGPRESEPLVAEGLKIVEEGFRSGLEAEALLVSSSGERELERLLRIAAESEAGISCSRVLRTSDRLFASVSGTESPQGVAALFRAPVWGLEDVLRGSSSASLPACDSARGRSPLVIVLSGVQDPGNVGTIIRSAEAFGGTGVVATKGTADPWSQKSIRASAGSAFRLPLLRGMSLHVLLAQLKLNQVQIVAASSRRYNNATADESQRILRDAVAIFIGNEAAGLPGEVEHAADARITIPISEAVDSLNAGIAASLLLYEAARQRRSGS